MGITKIEWTTTVNSDGSKNPGYTFNPWWGCTKVSPGCQNCYAETMSKRFGLELWSIKNNRKFFSEKHWQQPIKWSRIAEDLGIRTKVFCASMADVFEDNSLLDRERERLWNLIAKTPWIDWQILTKRPENVMEMLPWSYSLPNNIWIGTSIENQQVADKRLSILKQIPARVRFLSCEPLLESIDLDLNGIDWVIVGGESGYNCRPIEIDWVRRLRDNCQASGTAFFFKQWGCCRERQKPGGNNSKPKGRSLDDREWSEFPIVNNI